MKQYIGFVRELEPAINVEYMNDLTAAMLSAKHLSRKEESGNIGFVVWIEAEKKYYVIGANTEIKQGEKIIGRYNNGQFIK